MSCFRAALLILGSIGILDTVTVSMYSNMNAGTVLPALLGFPLLLIGIFFEPALRFFQAGFGLFLKWLLILGYGGYGLLLLITLPLLLHAGNKPAPQQADALIVLGCGVRGERVSLTLARRLDAALAYMEDNPDALVIVSGGQGPGESIAEGEAMYRYLVAHGARKDRLRKETASESTYENFLFSWKIIESELDPNASVAFVTTRFHVLRAERVAAKMGLNAQGFGARGVAWIEPNNYLRESLVLVYYFLQGRI